MFIGKLILSVIYVAAVFGGLLFVPAGTVHWWRAWVFVGVVVVGTIATIAAIFPSQMDSLNERFKAPIQKGQPLGDKIIIIPFVVSFSALIVLIPLDVFRFHIFGKPGAFISALGLALFMAGWWIISLAYKENAFTAPVVKVQEERHHTVVDTGVYAVVRHPMYAGALLVMIGMPLWLESYAATLFAIVPIALGVARALIEERFLRRELAGYDKYMEKVRNRIIPRLW
jgi:protein-S-isoprenylcysteine O-methyltransferase Ste14